MDEKIKILKHLKILFVEDDPVANEQMTSLLKILFKEVVSATDGSEGLQLFEKSIEENIPFDIILSDINMPNINGIAMVQEIRKIDQQIPVVFLTAFSDDQYLMQAIKVRVSDYILKPMQNNELIDTLYDAYLPRHQQKIIEIQNKKLIVLNQKIKNIAKQKIQKLQDKYSTDELFSSELIDLDNLFNSCEL